jgi:transcriptional regulator with XRE-family HTH domain
MGKIADAKKSWLAKELEKLANAGVSKAEVARRLGMLPQTLNNILNREKSVSDDFIDKFSETLGISLVGLFVLFVKQRVAAKM